MNCEVRRSDTYFASFHLCQVKEIIHQIRQILRRTTNELDLLFLFNRQVTVQAIQQNLAKSCDGIQGRPKFVTHIGEKMALQLRGALQKVGLVVEFGIESDDPAIGFIELPVEISQFLLPSAKLL